MKSNSILIVILLVVAGRLLPAQGLQFNDKAYRALPVVEEGGARDDEVLRNTFKVDLKPYCPSIKQQGKISSCVGWAVGYAAMSIQSAIHNKWAGDRKRIDDNAYSAMFLYNQIKLGDCDFGAELNQAFDFIKEKGNVLYRDFAVDYDCDSVPLKNLEEKARLNRIQGFSTLFYPDDREDVKISRVKLSLAQNMPVVVGMVVLQNFLTLKSTDEVWYPSIGNTELFGGHAMVVIGYDDAMKAFEVMNSWGTGWANKGFVWIRYDDFAKYCKYAFRLSFEKTSTNYLEGSVQIRKPIVKTIDLERQDVVFASLPFEQKAGYYRLLDNKNGLPLEFQLVIDGLRMDSYLYVIGFDKKFNATVHWPHDENLNRQFMAEYESAAITSAQREIIVPGKYNVFRIIEPVSEYLCILNSNGQIGNLSRKLEQISSGKGDLSARLEKVFGNVLKNDCGSYYNDERISFFANAEKNEMISLVLEFDVKK